MYDNEDVEKLYDDDDVKEMFNDIESKYKARIADLEAIICDLKDEIDDLKATIRDMDFKLYNLECKNDFLDCENEELRELREKFAGGSKTELEILRSKINDLELENCLLSEDINCLEYDNRQLRVKLGELELEMD